ncbi:unnamed protein product [Brassica napus]|uniref:(rape) hypothetical protein n=1 Tax=Brassica napus TaxID=3708 RepID=A0A816V208_BRANA|nr:unnamed protein product [Brassica napus]
MADLPEDPVSSPTFKTSHELLHLCKMDSLMPSSSRSLQHTKELPSSPSISSILFGEDALTVRAPLREQPPSSTTKVTTRIVPSPKNKLDATAGLEVSDPTNEIDSSKEAAEIASVNDIVSVSSSHAVNLPLDKVFASSPPIFVTGPGTAGASFTSDDDLIHRTRGDRLIKPSLKGTEFE